MKGEGLPVVQVLLVLLCCRLAYLGGLQDGCGGRMSRDIHISSICVMIHEYIIFMDAYIIMYIHMSLLSMIYNYIIIHSA